LSDIEATPSTFGGIYGNSIRRPNNYFSVRLGTLLVSSSPPFRQTIRINGRGARRSGFSTDFISWKASHPALLFQAASRLTRSVGLQPSHLHSTTDPVLPNLSEFAPFSLSASLLRPGRGSAGREVHGWPGEKGHAHTEARPGCGGGNATGSLRRWKPTRPVAWQRFSGKGTWITWRQ
jgi:hypothetical protein